MPKDSIPYERQLYSVWKQQQFNSPLKTFSGEDVEVLDVGAENVDNSGPDFTHARVRIGNFVYVGDIEIDPTYQDWKSHGHHIDNKYNKVILHASYQNSVNHGYVYTRDGRKIPTICLKAFVDECIIPDSEIRRTGRAHTPQRQYLRCSETVSSLSNDRIRRILSKLGVERMQKKANRIYHRMCELLFLREMNLKEPIINYELTPEFKNKDFHYSDFHDKSIWSQVLYEFLFEALGYSKNKSAMMNLAQSVTLEYLSRTTTEDRVFGIEASLLNAAGLAPSVTEYNESKLSEYVLKINERWKLLSKIYDGKIYEETDWQFFRLRPQNFPTIRIAGGAVLIDRILKNQLVESMLKKIKEIRNIKVLTNSIRSLFIVKGSGYWRKHYIFEDSPNSEIKYFIGVSRADEIIINVIIPYMILYFDVFGQEDLSKKMLKVYHMYIQRAENKIVQQVAHALDADDLLKRTVYTQGMLELFRNYCSKNKCGDCEIGGLVFN